MKNSRTIIVLGVALGLTISAGVIFLLTSGHAMSDTNHKLMFESQNTSHDANHTIAEESTEKNEQANTNQMDNLDGIEFVKYTVRSGDTLWRIARTFMPDYNAYPLDDKEGVIAYIVKKNLLKRDLNDRYVLYAGTTITVPKQKEIALDSIKKSTPVVKNTTGETVKSSPKTTSNSTSTTNTAIQGSNSQTSDTGSHSGHGSH